MNNNQLARRPTLPEGLNAAQLAAVQQTVVQLSEQWKLKQWCIEQVLKANVTNTPVHLARAIYDFITELPAVVEAREE